uniref:Uncharacterized protein LOC105036471 n=1 Tax=Elaeis guineensis var. tenera TaxID=51953 RepID=A0A6I9QLJ3_ELAGV
MPLRYGKLKANDWNPLTEKIIKKLEGWKGKLLSIVDRTTLLNAVITTTVMFWMSNFAVPSKLIKIIDKAHRTFLWCGNERWKMSKSLLNWLSDRRPKHFGGFGITNNKILNQ